MFEGVALPTDIKGLENVPFWEECDLELQDWILDLRYCWGRVRTLKSGKVLRCARTVRRLLLRDRTATLAHLQKILAGLTQAKAEEVITDWLAALDIIEERARSVSVCHWTVEPTEEEIEKTLTLTISMAQKAGNPTPGLEFKLRSLSQEEQLAFLARTSDQMSSPRPGFFKCLLSRLKVRARLRR